VLKAVLVSGESHSHPIIRVLISLFWLYKGAFEPLSGLWEIEESMILSIEHYTTTPLPSCDEPHIQSATNPSDTLLSFHSMLSVNH
jgi:hypothetical protein